MKKKKPVPKLLVWLDRLPVPISAEEVMQRMAYSEIVSETLRMKSPLLFWSLLIPLILVMLLPMMLLTAWVGEGKVLGPEALLPVVAWCCTSIPAGLGAVNLCMPLLQKFCEWRLRAEFPNGLEKPLYLGHGFTALFLLGFGGVAVLLTWILTLL